MRVGVPKEIKKNEHRVGLTPTAVREYVAHGHTVTVQTGAGLGAGFTDEAYTKAGATIVADAATIFANADMIVKVKEPQKVEWEMLREDQILFTYLHLAPDPEQTKGLLASKCAAIAYETVTDAQGGLPLLAPMSEVAGRIAVFSAAETLLKHNGGMGLLFCGVPGVAPARVLVLGGGVVGLNAARMAMGLGAEVVVLERSIPRMAYIDEVTNGRVITRYSSIGAIDEEMVKADVVIGAVLVPGAAAPKLIKTRAPEVDEAGLGAGRRRHRPGRLFRDQPRHDPRGPDLYRRRRRPLLRRQHAGRRAAHLVGSPEQRHPAVRPGAGRQGSGGAEGGPAPGARPQRPEGRDHLSGRRRSHGPELERSVRRLGQGVAAVPSPLAGEGLRLAERSDASWPKG